MKNTGRAGSGSISETGMEEGGKEEGGKEEGGMEEGDEGVRIWRRVWRTIIYRNTGSSR